MMPTILFVGESPPTGAPTDFTPFDCASGTRLATIMLGLKDRATMLVHVPRANIYDRPTGAKGCTESWEPMMALARGVNVLHERARHCRTVVALGRRTAEALGMPDPLRVPAFNWAPMVGATWRSGHPDQWGGTIMYVPHPSGQSQTLNDPDTRADVRAMLMPEIILGIPSLRPWHFRLDDPSTLAALSAALSPLCPALGAVALLHAEGQHKARTARASSPLLVRIAADAGVQLPKAAPWDEPMTATAKALLQHDGARVLARRWDLSSPLKKDATLATAAKPHAHLNVAQSRPVMRATLARYAAAGLA